MGLYAGQNSTFCRLKMQKQMVTVTHWRCDHLLCCRNVAIYQSPGNFLWQSSASRCCEKGRGRRPPAVATKAPGENLRSGRFSATLLPTTLCGSLCIKRRLSLNQTAHRGESVCRCCAMKPLEGSVRVRWPCLLTTSANTVTIESFAGRL